MMQFYTKRDNKLLTYGSFTEETRSLIFVPPGAEVVYESAPEEAKEMPPNPGDMWNLETGEWEALPVTIEESWAKVKYQRDKLLKESDWVTLRSQETGKPVPDTWKDYRQALRDITEQTDPLNIIWPVKPD